MAGVWGMDGNGILIVVGWVKCLLGMAKEGGKEK